MPDTLLIELLTEELPPKSLRKLSDAFASEIFAALKRDALTTDASIATPYATPRRLAVTITNVLEQAPDRAVELKGPAVSAALDEQGQPKPALLGFAKKCGVGVESLQRAKDAKGEYFVYKSMASGGVLKAMIAATIMEAAKTLPVAKIMRWGDNEAQFVRPVQGVLVLHGQTLIPVKLFDAADTTATTRGHRFLAKVSPIAIGSADDYAVQLERDGAVIASFDKRKARIEQALNEKARGAKMFMDDALLEEVTALTEWPAVYEGQFDAAFLAVPQECLILTMQQNQRYFPLAGSDGKLTNRFLVVSNLATDDPKDIIAGNERVLRARLADAKFFYEQDKKKTLDSRIPLLGNVVYHNKLGSQLERVQRIVALSAWIAGQLGADQAHVAQAARLCKADLLTDMVGEFPELQGVMGHYYAALEGAPAAVGRAIEDHYKPRFAGDTLPEDNVGMSVALAERADTLIGIFGIGQIPSGDKDPFGLRRQALGVLRMLSEKTLPLELNALLERAREAFASQGKRLEANAVDAAYQFSLERLRNFLREGGYAPDEVEAVVAQNPTRIDLVAQRLDAVRAFKRLPEAEALAAANKRIRNILKGVDSELAPAQSALFAEAAERQLHGAIGALEPKVTALVAKQDYAGALTALAGIRGDVDHFFDKVMVMAEDAKLRANRLSLLQHLGRLMNRVADISRLAA